MTQYLPALKDLGPTCQLQVLDEDSRWHSSSTGLRATKEPGIYEALVRCVNYVIEADGSYQIQDPDAVTRSHNLVLNLKVEARREGTQGVELSVEHRTLGFLSESRFLGDDRFASQTVGLEDVPLLGPTFLSAMSLEWNDDGLPQICLAARRGLEITRIIPLLASSSIEEDRCLRPQQGPEKNWLPFPYPGGDLCHFVYSLSPLRILEVDLWRQTNPCLAYTILEYDHGFMRRLRGSAGPIRWNLTIDEPGWLFLAHLVTDNRRRRYYHLFIWWDHNFRQYKYSHVFTFERQAVEFCTGMTAFRPSPDSDSGLLIVYIVSGIESPSCSTSTISCGTGQALQREALRRGTGCSMLPGIAACCRELPKGTPTCKRDLAQCILERLTVSPHDLAWTAIQARPPIKETPATSWNHAERTPHPVLSL